jgi:YfiH family protein
MMTVDATLAGISGLRHGFMTRRGGVSTGIYAGLNCGFGSADAPDRVAENRRRALAALELAPEALVTLHQVHSPTCLVANRTWTPQEAPRGDALATRVPGIALGILGADCAPVLFADPEAGVVAAAHAGWKGAKGGVLEATVAAMDSLGAVRSRIVAAIGPCIGPASYETGPAFRAGFADDPAAAGLFTASPRPGHALFDLPAYIRRRLAALGLGAIAACDRDTVTLEADYFSYRRACLRGEPDYGRQLSVIALVP